MIIMGIDPGTAIVGYGIIEYEKGKYKVLDYGCIYTDKSMEMSKRLLKINENLEMLINMYNPEWVAVEELFFFKNNKTVISVGQARGVIMLCVEKLGKKLAEYTPLQVKMGITGYGKSTKKQVQEMTKIVLNLETIPKPDDAADALAIAITHANSLGTYNIRQNKSNLEENENKVSIKGKNKLTAEEYRKLMLQ